jgi:uncharacterized protein
MFIGVRDLEVRKATFDVAFPPGRVDLQESEFRQITPLRMTGVAELAGAAEEIRVFGHIAGVLEAECDRCLEAATFEIDRDFDLFYRPVSEDPGQPDLELEPGDCEIGFYEGAGFDLADVLQEQVLLWLPMHWVCRDDCQGICPVCGGNRNRTACACQAAVLDDRWAALRDFRPSRSKTAPSGSEQRQ